jgi:hypothetical protein
MCLSQPDRRRASRSTNPVSSDSRRAAFYFSTMVMTDGLWRTFCERLEAVAHDVNIIDAEVGLLAVLVVLHVLGPCALGDIGHGIGRRSRVDDEIGRLGAVDGLLRSGRAGRVQVVRMEDGLDELLVLYRAGVLDADHGLGGPGDGALCARLAVHSDRARSERTRLAQ